MASSALSVAQRVNAERLTVLAWPTAILMQLAHPLVAEGVYEHSSFRSSPLAAVRRLHATVQAMLDLSFGDASAHESALERIRQIHRRVHGQLNHAVGRFPAGTRYSAEDPALVLWVHLTLLDALPRAFSRLVAPLGDPDLDAYCVETADVATALGARREDVPLSWRDLQARLARTLESGELVVSPHARELAAAVMHPPTLRWVPPLGWHHRLVAIGLLPPSLRAQFGFDWDPARQRRFDWAARMLRRARGVVPDAVALWPQARDAAAARH